MAKSRIFDATLRLVDKFSEPLKKVDNHLTRFEEHYKRTGDALYKTSKNLGNIGSTLTKSVTAPIVALGALSTKAWKDVDNGLDTIATKTGATGDVMKGFEKNFRNVASNMPVDMQKVGDAIGEVNTQFGLTGKALEDASEYMIKFSEINGQDVSQASIQAKQAMSAYGLEGDKLNQVLDAVTKTAQDTGQGTDKLFDIVTKGAPQLKSLGLGFEQATAMLGAFEKGGIDSNKAMSYLSKAQVTFAKSGLSMGDGLKVLQKELAGAKTDAEKLTIANKYFGSKGANFMLDAINRGIMDFDKFSNAADLAGGSVGNTFEETLDPIDKFKKLFNNLKFAGADLFSASEGIWGPLLDKAIDKVKKLTDWFSGLSDGQKQNIVKWLGMAAAIGPGILAFSKIYKVVGKFHYKLFDLSKSIKNAGGILKWIKSPTTIAIIAIVAIIGAVILLMKNWDKIKAKAEKIFPGIGETMSRIFKNMETIGKAVMGQLIKIVKSLKETWQEVWTFLEPLVKIAIKGIEGAIKILLGVFDGVIEFIAGVFTGNWSKAWDGVVKIFSNIFNGVKEIAKGIINGVINAFNTAIGGLNKIKAPDWVPIVGGKGINIPLIPQLAGGTDFWSGGLVQVHERGGEIVDLPRGSRVMPHDKSVAEAYKMGAGTNNQNTTINIPKLADQIVVREDADIDKIVNKLAVKLKMAKLNRIGGTA